MLGLRFGWQALGLGRNGVIVFLNEPVDVTDGLEQRVDASASLDGPEHALAVLEPRVCKDAVDAPHDVCDVADGGLVAGAVWRAERHAAREQLHGGEDITRPVESVDAVVDGAAGFGCIVYGAQVLPF